MKHGNLSYEFLYIPFEFYCIEFKVIFILLFSYDLFGLAEKVKGKKKKKNDLILNVV